MIGDLKVIHMPGHSPGGIVLLDMLNQRIFTGDMCYPIGLVIDNFPSSNVDQCIESVTKIISLAPKFTRAFPGHGNVMPCGEVVDFCDFYLRSKKAK
jgi:glyoxylase-like metal-dependent hydrolase (beta-lactamase superfamily II)